MKVRRTSKSLILTFTDPYEDKWIREVIHHGTEITRELCKLAPNTFNKSVNWNEVQYGIFMALRKE